MKTNEWHANHRGKQPDNKMPKRLVYSCAASITLVVLMLSLFFKSDLFVSKDILEEGDIVTFSKNTTVETIESQIEQGSTTPSSNMQINTDEWFTEMPNIVGDKSETVKLKSLTAYKNPPLSSMDETYFYNFYKAKGDLLSYLHKLAPDAKPLYSSRTDEYIMDNYLTVEYEDDYTDNRQFDKSDTNTANGTLCYREDGIEFYYTAVLPNLCSMDYYSSGTWAKASHVYQNLRNDYYFYYLACLFPKGGDPTDESTYIYLPFVIGDTKAHTYPWGVVQTNVVIKDENTIYAATGEGGDYAHKFTVNSAADDASVKEALTWNGYTAHYGNMFDGMAVGGIETCGMKSEDRNAITDKYNLAGFIVYKKSRS